MIYVECKPDEVLVQTLSGLPRAEVIHEFKGKFEVLRRLDNGRDLDALLDENPAATVPSTLRQMREQQDLEGAPR